MTYKPLTCPNSYAGGQLARSDTHGEGLWAVTVLGTRDATGMFSASGRNCSCEGTGRGPYSWCVRGAWESWPGHQTQRRLLALPLSHFWCSLQTCPPSHVLTSGPRAAVCHQGL